MNRIFFFSILLIAFCCDINAGERGSSAPYISGDTFRAYCDFTYDELSKNIDPHTIPSGSTIFVKTDYIEEFFTTIHPHIPNCYIIITHNSDCSAPGRCAHYLEDDKILAWFGQNIEFYHPKLHPIPIGIANKCWNHGDVEKIKQTQDQVFEHNRNILLYMNFTVGTYFEERNKVAEMFKNKSYCVISEPKEYRAYLTDLTQSKFVLCPRGNGEDCHRTWESLLMGAIPIVKSSSLDRMFENLPVIIINDWNEINEYFLYEKYEQIKSRHFLLEKMYIGYWLSLIESYK